MKAARLKMNRMKNACAIAIVACGAASTNAQAQTQTLGSSSVNVYGLMDVWLGSTRIVGQSQATKGLNSHGFQGQFWGVSGVEDLGGGNRAIFALESFFSADTGALGRTPADPFWGRNAYIGLAGDWGTARVGRLVTPYFQALVLTDPFGGAPFFSPQASASYRGLNGSGLAGNTSLNNLVAYTSPKVANMTANVVYGFGEAAGQTGKNQMQATLTYQANPLTLNFAYQDSDYNNIAGDFTFGMTKQKAYMLGASYDLGAVKLFSQYERTKSTAVPKDFKNDIYQAGVSIPVSLGYVLASYAYSKIDDLNIRRKTWALGYDYFLSKRTDVYLALLNDRATGFNDGQTYGIGIRHRF